MHEPHEMTVCLAGSYASVLTPSTIVASCPLAGALMMTFLAPAVEVRRRLLLVGEEARALEDDVDAELLPRQLRRVLLGEHLGLDAAEVDRAFERRRRVLARDRARCRSCRGARASSRRSGR